MIKFFTKIITKEVEVRVPESVSSMIQRFAPGVKLFDGKVVLVVSEEDYIKLCATYKSYLFGRMYADSIERYYGIKIMKKTDYDFEIAVRAEAKKRLEGK